MFSYLDWHNPIYLRRGSNLQRRAAAILHSLGIFSTLAQYDPVLAGTIPLDLALDDSDLDIICEVHDLEQFANLLISNYSHLAGFRIKEKAIRGVQSVVANFQFGGFPVEVFGQPQPVREQYAYRHMDVEARLLDIGGPDAREQIHSLKREGHKTEPAFALYFNLSGDPYEVLLSLSALDDEALRWVTSHAHQRVP